MLTEWKSNLWIVIELVIVLFVIQFLFGFILSTYDMYSSNKGYNLDGVYYADVKYISSKASDFQPYDSLHSYLTDTNVILSNIRNNPHVEYAAFGSANAAPYNYNFYGFKLHLAEADTTYEYYANRREMDPEMARVIQLVGVNGETTDQLVEMLERGDMLISEMDRNYTWAEGIAPAEIFHGREVFIGNDTASLYHVGAIVGGMRRVDFEPLGAGVGYNKPNWSLNYLPQLLGVRVKPGEGRQFIESLTPNDKHHNNAYLSKIVSVDLMRDRAHLQYTQMVRNVLIGAFFLMLVLFLGFLGTFWFRTQQRVGEIALRKVNGATDRDIFKRFIGEGLILFTMAIVIVETLVIATLSTGLLDNMVPSAKITTCAILLSIIVLALLIVAGIWSPARRAMNVNPAYALKDQ